MDPLRQPLIEIAGVSKHFGEGETRVAGYDSPGGPADVLPRPPEFDQMQRNSSFEALAIIKETLTTQEGKESVEDLFVTKLVMQ